MINEFDDKGKIFTHVIKKKPVAVYIQTSNQLIRGKIHIRPDERLKDELNASDQFIAVTDARIYSQDGEKVDLCSFLAINRDHILWLFQDQQAIETEGEA